MFNPIINIGEEDVEDTWKIRGIFKLLLYEYVIDEGHI